MRDVSAATSSDAADRILTLPDSRHLGYREYGDATGRPVVALHGTPGSRFKYSGSHEAAAAVGLRLIAIDRWGYGLSSVKPGAKLAEYGADVAVLADALGLATFQVTGVSGGAPFAVAVAAHMKNRVTGLALVSPVGPLSGSAGNVKLSPFHVVCFRVLPRIPRAIAAVFLAYRGGLKIAPNWAMWLAVSRSASVDRRVMSDPKSRSRLIEAFSNGLHDSVRGPVIDMTLFGQSWGLDFSSITARTCVWIGTNDRNVPSTAVEGLIAAIPHCQAVVIPGAGHSWVANNADVIMNWLANPANELTRR